MADDILQQQAASQQGPSAPVPLPINPAQAIMGVPPQPQAQPQQPTQQTPQQTQPTPEQQVQAHHSAVGQAISHYARALEGKQVVYNTDPTTGDVTSQVVPRKAGGFFRDILLGAISGEVAASQPIQHASGAAGFARGFMGAQQGLQQQQDTRQKQAQAKGAEIQQMNARQLAAASVAHDTVTSLDLGHNLNFHNPDELDQYNASVNAVKDQAMKVGGQLVALPNGIENGKVGNAPLLLAAVNQDPSLMQAPEGYHRVPFIIHDPGELEHDGTNWKGKADWNGQATVFLVDIPNESWGKSVSLPNKTWNAAAGRQLTKGDPNANATSTFGSLFAVGLKNKQDLIAARNERERGPKDENEAQSWKSAAADADPNSPNYALIQSRAKKGQAFMDAQEEIKNSGKGGPPTPKTLAESAVDLANAKFADSQGSTPETKKALAQAQQVYDTVKTAKRDELDAEYQTQLRLASGKADAERKAKEDYDRNLYRNVLATGDQTGWTPPANQFMTEQQFNSAKDKFASGPLTKAEDTDKSYQMFQDAYNEYKAANGKLPTGAQSMLALSTHLSTTFGNVKGSRVTKDMIQEHLGARSVSDTALVAVQKLTSGDVLSPKQWAAFNDLITDSRNKQWDNAVANAHYRGLPADFLPEDRRTVTAQPTKNSPATQPRSSGANRPANTNQQNQPHPFFSRYGGKADNQ